MIPGLPPPFLHTASDQKLYGGKAWERSYLYTRLGKLVMDSPQWGRGHRRVNKSQNTVLQQIVKLLYHWNALFFANTAQAPRSIFDGNSASLEHQLTHLAKLTCVPTTHGMCQNAPSQRISVYFSKVSTLLVVQCGCAQLIISQQKLVATT